ncbi:hypothetical protein [Pseudomonas mangiferae]|uniref:Uncharacterized protein n=1 Tax=Pseudomonas mangiferae TaxID=2593654 RepID=A0A553H2X0_9PSED|nr:hypothetical protein [Pseudomonas mangiferae]TRX76065.1 hypothetical protein FM069_02435 [Pseudomonas mangiferae]
MRRNLLYAGAYNILAATNFSIVYYISNDYEKANFLAFAISWIFPILWRPSFFRILLSAALASLLFSVDLQQEWYWISNEKSAEVEWMYWVVGISSAAPLTFIWLCQQAWALLGRRHASREKRRKAYKNPSA